MEEQALSQSSSSLPPETGREQFRRVLTLSIPAILAQISTMAMQYIDSAMVGSLGVNASAAIGLVTSSTWLLAERAAPGPACSPDYRGTALCGGHLYQRRPAPVAGG